MASSTRKSLPRRTRCPPHRSPPLSGPCPQRKHQRRPLSQSLCQSLPSLLPVVQQQPATQPQAPAPTRIFVGAKLFIEDTGEFGMALTAAFIDRKVPVSVVSNPEKADFIVKSVSQDRRAGQGEKIARILFSFGESGDRYHAVVSIVNQEGTIVFAYNVKKGNFQNAANSTANEIKKKQIQRAS